LLEKDVGIIRDVARARGASEPPALVRLADSTLETLRGE
jgi:hypothetical protein